MNQQKLREWIMKQDYFSLNPKYDGMTAWELAGIIIREGQEEVVSDKLKEEQIASDKELEKLIEDNEQKLMDIHAKGYMGTDDDMVENFEKWVTGLTLQQAKKYLQPDIAE